MKPTIYAPFLSLVATAWWWVGPTTATRWRSGIAEPTPTSVRFTGRPWPGGSSFS